MPAVPQINTMSYKLHGSIIQMINNSNQLQNNAVTKKEVHYVTLQDIIMFAFKTFVHIVLLHHYAGFISRYLYFSIILQAQIWSWGVILFQKGSQPEVLKHDWLQHGNRQLIFGRMRSPRFMISEKARGHSQYKTIKHDGIPLFLTMSQLVSLVVFVTALF